jgi:hypothetical protein
MKFIITQKQYQLLKESLDDVLDLYSKKSRGETLRPSEMDVLRAFDKHQKKGGNPEDFVFNQDDVYDIDEREGTRFKYNLKGRPFTFEFSEEMEQDDEIEYYGEVTFMGDEFLGVIVTDKRGYLVDYDFYNTLSDEDIRLQDVLKKEDSDLEIQNFFQEEVIPTLKK